MSSFRPVGLESRKRPRPNHWSVNFIVVTSTPSLYPTLRRKLVSDPSDAHPRDLMTVPRLIGPGLGGPVYAHRHPAPGP
jgi:hypothetical protein